MLSAEMARANQNWQYAGARILDSHRLEALAIPRSLSVLYEKYTGKKHEGAHGALSDVQASAEVIAAQLKMHDALPKDIDKLHASQWPGYIDTEGRFRMIAGIPTITFGKFRGKPMREVDHGYWLWMGGPKSSFSEEIKAIALAAALGNYPK
jgi:DNA polymerase-3 subunit epsilon